MQPGFMCAAGIDLDMMRHIRPVVGGLMKIDLLAEHGGPFELRRIVNLGATEFVGRTPEIEDRLFKPENVTVHESIDKRQFLSILEQVAGDSLPAIFGKDLQLMHYDGHPSTAAVAEGCGLRSLGCYQACEPAIEVQHFGGCPRVRFQFTENRIRFGVPVTDIRCYAADHVTPDTGIIEVLQRKLKPLPRVLVSIGLSRAWQKSSETGPMHWLQINNIHLPV